MRVLQFVFVKGSNNFFSIKIVHIICPQYSIFDLSQILPQTNLECNLLQKSFSSIINFKFRIFVIKMFAICVWFYINGLHFNCAMIFVIVFTNHIIYFINTHFLKLKSCIYKFVFKVLINLSATTDSPSLCAEYISVSFFSNYDFIDLL